MRKLTLATLGLVMLTTVGGCMDARLGKFDPLATPAYSGQERGDLIARNIEFEWKQINDDVDTLLMLRPVGQLTIWHLR
jgi:hypothetical protein